MSSFSVAFSNYMQHLPPSRSTELWFEDGNIILRADTILFRVYRGILTSNSTIFSRMLSTPHPGGAATDLYDGCPVILLDDSAKDLVVFLKAMHNSNYYNPKVHTPYSTVASILRLSTKYQVPFLRQCALEQLDARFPSTWEGMCSYMAGNTDLIIPSAGYTIDAANLARECNAPWLLPFIFYGWCSSGVGQLLNGVLLPNAKYMKCSDADQKMCLIAHKLLLTAHRRRTFAFITNLDYRNCQTPAQCVQTRREFYPKIEKTITGDDWCQPILPPFSWKRYIGRVCPPCAHFARTSYEQVSKDIWDELPAFFGLPSWDQLRAA